MGGTPPLGYDVDSANRRLVVNEQEAKTVRFIFKRFAELGSPLGVAGELNTKGVTTTLGKPKPSSLGKTLIAASTGGNVQVTYFGFHNKMRRKSMRRYGGRNERDGESQPNGQA